MTLYDTFGAEYIPYEFSIRGITVILTLELYAPGPGVTV